MSREELGEFLAEVRGLVVFKKERSFILEDHEPTSDLDEVEEDPMCWQARPSSGKFCRGLLTPTHRRRWLSRVTSAFAPRPNVISKQALKLEESERAEHSNLLARHPIRVRHGNKRWHTLSISKRLARIKDDEGENVIWKFPLMHDTTWRGYDDGLAHALTLPIRPIGLEEERTSGTSRIIQAPSLSFWQQPVSYIKSSQ